MESLEQIKKNKPNIENILGLGTAASTSSYQRWRLQIMAGFAVVITLMLVIWWSSGGPTDAVRYVTAPATRTDLTVIVTATGTVQPTNQVDVSSELSGTIRKVLVDYNSSVTVGQHLAILDTDKLKATAEAAKAKLAAARAKVADAEATIVEKKLDYDRKRRLADRQVTSEHDEEAAKAAYDRAVASLASAKADVDAAAADLKLHETNLAKTCICSPIDGVVLARNVEPGQIVASSFQAPVLFSIAQDLKKMEVQVDVDEADVGKVKEGQHASFTVDAYPDRSFTAQIRELRYGSEVVQGVVTYKAVLTADNSELLLRPGMTATAEITVQRVRDVVSVPNAALRFSPPSSSEVSDDRSFLHKLLPGRPPFRPPSARVSIGPERKVWVLKNGEAIEIEVTVGASDGSRTQIIKGDIEPGQPMIVDIASTN